MHTFINHTNKQAPQSVPVLIYITDYLETLMLPVNLLLNYI